MKRTLLLLAISMLAAALARAARADTLTITSTPPGATVEIDGLIVGKTPYEMKVPGGYFHKSTFGIHLEHAMRLRVSMEKFSSKEIEMTNGPIPYISYTAFGGAYKGDCWVLKTNHFDVTLEPNNKTFTGAITTAVGNFTHELRLELAVEEIVQQTKPAVVLLRRPDGHGSGFFITDTGVIATNAHVARGAESMVAELSSGEKLDARVVYVDDDKDIALVKVEGRGFPHLALSELTSVRQGQTVVALGNPGYGLPFSATKGIVSAFGKAEEHGKGTWIQTDASINPGNSGGPLLNSHAEVVGLNTSKIVADKYQGIGFALSSHDLMEVLHRFYPTVTSIEGLPSTPAAEFGIVKVVSDPAGADVYVDGKFVGNAPATLKIPVGEHDVRLSSPNRGDWERTLEILNDSQVSLIGQLTTAK